MDNSTLPQEAFHPTSYLRFPPQASDRVPITAALYAKHILPVYACYCITAVLVQQPQTRVHRSALLPVTLSLAWIAAVAFDLSGGDPRYNFLSFGQCVGTVYHL
jgi:hypothetical protein